MKREKKQVVDLEAFEIIREERDALQKENEDLKNDVDVRNKKIDELRKGGDTLQALLDVTRKERDSAQLQLKAAKKANDSLMEEIEQLKAQATEAHGQFQKRVKELGDGLDASAALLKTAQDERDVARRQVDGLEKDLKAARTWNDVAKATNAGLVAAGDELREQLKAQEEVIERLKAQNSNFCEEQREAKKRAASLAADMALAREEVARLVRLNDDFRERLQKVTTEKNQILEISNGFARERDEIRADYEARGKVIKKLRKRLHKLKKKLKH